MRNSRGVTPYLFSKMKLCRFKITSGRICPGLMLDETTLLDLSSEVES